MTKPSKKGESVSRREEKRIRKGREAQEKKLREERVLRLLQNLDGSFVKREKALEKAMKEGNAEAVRDLLLVKLCFRSNGDLLFKHMDEDVIKTAIRDESTDVMNFLLKKRLVDPNEVLWRVSLWLCYNKEETIAKIAKIAEIAIDNGANVNARSERGVTLLCYVIDMSNVAVVDALIQRGADVRAQNPNGEAPLHYAVSSLASGMIMYLIMALIDAGADVNVQDEEGITPLHRAAKLTIGCRDISTTRALIRLGADVNAQDKKKMTPLHYFMQGMFATSRCEKALRLLLTQKTIDLEVRDVKERTPLLTNVCRKNQQREVIRIDGVKARLALEFGAEMLGCGSEGADWNCGDNPLTSIRTRPDVLLNSTSTKGEQGLKRGEREETKMPDSKTRKKGDMLDEELLRYVREALQRGETESVCIQVLEAYRSPEQAQELLKEAQENSSKEQTQEASSSSGEQSQGAGNEMQDSEGASNPYQDFSQCSNSTADIGNKGDKVLLVPFINPGDDGDEGTSCGILTREELERQAEEDDEYPPVPPTLSDFLDDLEDPEEINTNLIKQALEDVKFIYRNDVTSDLWWLEEPLKQESITDYASGDHNAPIPDDEMYADQIVKLNCLDMTEERQRLEANITGIVPGEDRIFCEDQSFGFLAIDVYQGSSLVE